VSFGVEDGAFWMRCCAGDGGWPSGTALQGEVSNHRKLLRLRAVVVSVAEKAHVMRQVRAGKANVSEPLLKRRKRSGVIKTGVQSLPRDEPGGCLLTGQVVTGVKVARAGSGAGMERGNLSPRWRWPVLGWPAEGSPPSSRNCEGPSTGAGHRGGPSRSSGEAR
jgi:hypothetical protein